MIRDVYEWDDLFNVPLCAIKSFGLPKAIQAIIYPDKFDIPEEIKLGQYRDQYVMNWLDQNMQKYLPNIL